MPTTNGSRVLRSAWGCVQSCWRYLGEIMGERDYEKYVAYLRKTQPCTPIPTEKEYWKMRWSDAERNPQGRCC